MIQIIAKRYAKALVELAHEKNTVDRTKADLAAFASAVAEQATLQKLFASPAFTPDAKKSVIGELAGKLGRRRRRRGSSNTLPRPAGSGTSARCGKHSRRFSRSARTAPR